jgi:hypothetical protein
MNCNALKLKAANNVLLVVTMLCLLKEGKERNVTNAAAVVIAVYVNGWLSVCMFLKGFHHRHSYLSRRS